MKYLKKFNESNESQIYGYEILPEEVLNELQVECDIDYKDNRNKIQVCPDPKVQGVYAIRFYRHSDKAEFDVLWSRGGFEDVEFNEFPPKSGEPKFFI